MTSANQNVDFGILNPETTEVLGNGPYYILEGAREQIIGGESVILPYAPQLITRKKGRRHAGIAVTFRIKSGVTVDFDKLSELGFFMGLDFLRRQFGGEFENILELVLIKMIRPGAPQGVEWNAPGGICEVGEDADGGVRREFLEEARGMQIIASTLLLPNVQAASGAYLELNDITAVLAIGTPIIDVNEGALEWRALPWRSIIGFDLADQLRDMMVFTGPNSVNFCGVDLKVYVGVLEVLRHLARLWRKG